MRSKPTALPILSPCVFLPAKSAIPKPQIITLGRASANGDFVSGEPIKIRAGRTAKIRYTLEDSLTRLVPDD